MSGWKTAAVVASFLVALGGGIVVRGEILGDYLSYTACEPCHADIVAGWKTTKHAQAFEDLKTQGEEKQSVPECVQCHVVAYQQDGGFIDADLTPELEGVQCESCHGPGKKHTTSLSVDDLGGKVTEEVCRKCHTESQDKEFNFEEKSKLVHGAQ
jgi:hypothetical protein